MTLDPLHLHSLWPATPVRNSDESRYDVERGDWGTLVPKFNGQR